MLIVLKYGGNAMGPADADPVLDDLARRARDGDRIVVVHGGGPHIDRALAERAIVSERVADLRVTDAEALGVIEAVLCATVNKALVRALQRRRVPAAGTSGEDGPLLVARRAPPIGGASLGFVGEIETVRPDLLRAMLDAGFVPVVAPLGVTADGATALNVNADTAAGAIAGALGADAYVAITSVDRVRRVANDPATALARLTRREALDGVVAGIFDGGMRPKIASAVEALERGARRAIVTGAGPNAISRALAGDGTAIVDG